MLAPPPGNAYNFILNLTSYSLFIINVFVAIVLSWVSTHRARYDWHPPVRATIPVVAFFLLSNLYFVFAPYAPHDTPEQNQYKSLPYWLHGIVGLGIFAAGGLAYSSEVGQLCAGEAGRQGRGWMEEEHLREGHEIVVPLAERWYVRAVQKNLVLCINCTRIYISTGRFAVCRPCLRQEPLVV